MNKNLLVIGLVGLVFLASCGKDDEAPAPPHIIVGTWELDGVSFHNLPAVYRDYWEGLTFPSAFFYNAESFEIEFLNDNTYKLNVKRAGPDINESGTWEITDDELTMLAAGGSGLERVYIIEEDISELSLQISLFEQFPLISDDIMEQIADTIPSTTNIWNYVLFDMDKERFDELSDAVPVYFLHNFEKKSE